MQSCASRIRSDTVRNCSGLVETCSFSAEFICLQVFYVSVVSDWGQRSFVLNTEVSNESVLTVVTIFVDVSAER
jgi:hypothetical protein